MAVKKTEPKKKAPAKEAAKKAASSKASSSSSSKASAEPMLQALPEEAWRDLFGLAKKADRDFGDKLVSALAKIDRGLLPPAAAHPMEAHIARGEAGLEALFQELESGDDRAWFNALDALGHVFFALTAPDRRAGTSVPAAALQRLRGQLKGKTPDQQALVMKVLAIGQDEAVLREQLTRLADTDPGLVATAARLLGLGRYQPAARLLRELISPERFYESRAVIWALGEIGDASVLPALYRSLGNAFRVVDCLIAIGKIGQITSVGELMPMALSGAPEQRDAAWRAMAMILDHHRNDQKNLGEIFSQVKNLIEAQLNSQTAELSGSTRFHMLLCLARMGVTLDPPRVRRYLQLGVDESEASAVAKVFEKKPK